MSTPECPRCGWNRAGTTGRACVLPRVTHESVVSTDEIPQLEDQIRRPDEDRAAILRRINSVRSATRRLPPEILSIIFQFVSPPFDFIPPFSSDDFRKEVEPCICDEMLQCKMAAVSHVWRQAAISTPQLWTSISLGIHLSFINATLSSLHLFSHNAKRHPMSIELDFRDRTTAWSDYREECLLLMEPIKEAVFVDHADRIQSLRLIEPPTEWFPHLKNLSRCDTLVISRPSRVRNHGHIDLTELPYLRHVVLVHPWYPFSLPRSTITTLHLLSVPSIICMELLISCQNLIEFEIYSPSCGEGDPLTTNVVNGPITLEQIEYLTWSSDYCDCLPSIQRCIGYLRFAKLRALQWYGDNRCYSSSDGRDQRLDFFSNLPITLSSLTLNRFVYFLRDSILKELLSSIPQLRELNLIDCNADCVESIINAIGRSSIPPPENDQQQEGSPEFSRAGNQTFLPHLSKISVIQKGSVKTLDGYKFVDMLEALRAAGTSPKQFQLTIYDPYIFWNTDDRDRMRILVAFGFSVYVNGISGFP